MKKGLCFFLFLVSLPLMASEIPGHTIALDLGWTTEGFFNEGAGAGILIDLKLSPHFFARLRHGVIETDKTVVGKRVGNYVSALLIGSTPFATSHNWLEGFFVATGGGYDQIITADPTSGSVADHFLLPFWDISLGYRFTIGRVIIEPYVSILLPFTDPQRNKTGIALYTRHVDLEGLSLGILF